MGLLEFCLGRFGIVLPSICKLDLEFDGYKAGRIIPGILVWHGLAPGVRPGAGF